MHFGEHKLTKEKSKAVSRSETAPLRSQMSLNSIDHIVIYNNPTIDGVVNVEKISNLK